MEALQQQINSFLEGPIDFEGQKLTEKITQYGLGLVTALAFIAGYFLNSVKMTMFIYLGGYILILLITVPAWPAYNRHPSSWLPVRKLKDE